MIYSMLGLPSDLILEIVSKLRYSDLDLFLTNKRFLDIYSSNEKWITKKIVCSYNLIMVKVTDLQYLIKFGLVRLKIDAGQIIELPVLLRHKDVYEHKDLEFVIKNSLNYKNSYCFTILKNEEKVYPSGAVYQSVLTRHCLHTPNVTDISEYYHCNSTISFLANRHFS